MQIPTNVLQWYVGIPVMLLLGVSGWRSAKKRPNQITKNLSVAGFLMAAALTIYVIPVTFTTDGSLIGKAIFIGDLFQYFSLYLIWLIVIRIYLSGNKPLELAAILAATILAGVCASTSYLANIPYNTQIIMKNGHAFLDFAYPFSYAVATAVDFLSLIIVAIHFGKQAFKLPNSSGLKWRLLAFAAFFGIVGALFVSQPILSFDMQSYGYTASMIIGFLLLAFLLLVASVIRRKESQTIAKS